MLNKNSLLSVLAITAAGMSSFRGGAEALDRYDFPIPKRYAHGTGRLRSTPKGGNPAGTKLARKAANGKLGIWS